MSDVKEPAPPDVEVTPTELRSFGRTFARPWPADYTPTDFAEETVGSTFHSWDGHDYDCIAFTPNLGFWMVRWVPGWGNRPGRHVGTNVSGRAIGATYHKKRANGSWEPV